MILFSRFRPQLPELPDPAREALALAKGERVLAAAVDDLSGSWVVATTRGLSVVSRQAERLLQRPWHLVDAGVWQHETFQLTVTWVDAQRPVQWTFRDQQTLLPEVLRERVQASVVLTTRLTVGERRSARVAIRKDLATGELVSQTILGKGVRGDDPHVREQVAGALADLEDQVGLHR